MKCLGKVGEVDLQGAGNSNTECACFSNLGHTSEVGLLAGHCEHCNWHHFFFADTYKDY